MEQERWFAFPTFNIEIEWGLAESVAELPGVAAGLVRRKVDVLFASGSPTVLPAREAAGTIPVVFVGIFDFVETGQVASLARPGGNLTGMSGMVVDLAGKRMQLLKELLPGMTRVAILVRTASPATPPFVREAERSAQILGLELQVLRMGNPSDLEMLLASASTAEGLIGSDDAVFTAHRLRIAALALKKQARLWEDFYDRALAEQRASEPRERLEAVKRRVLGRQRRRAEYRVVFARSARRELEGLEEVVARRIIARVEALASDPRPHGCVTLQ